MAMTAIDDLILNLIETGRQASAEEVAAIVAHVAQAPFATYLSRVPANLRERLAQKGVILPTRLSSLERHLVKRIYEEEQWPVGTTAEGYVGDLQKAVVHPLVQIWTYRYFGQPFVGFLAPSHVQGAIKPEPYIFVAYSPEHQTLTTGYQASGSHRIFTNEYTDVVRHQ